MSELYLIAHKVSGEAAFDVALRMDCPLCALEFDDGVCDSPGCEECDQLGYWWIIPTSGHRAYPYWSVSLANIDDQYELNLYYWKDLGSGSEYWPPEMPEGLQDHYQHGPTPKVDISALLKSNQPPRPTMTRRL